MCGRRSLAPRRRRIRALGRGQPTLPPPHRRLRARRLVGHRCAQVAERTLRLRRRLLPASGVARRGDDPRRELSPAWRGPESVRLGARSLAPRTRLRRVGRIALAWTGGCGRPRRALLRPRAGLRGSPRGRTRRRDPERRRPQPGARPLRGRRRDDARGGAPCPGRRHMLARRHRLAGPGRDADLGLQLPHDRGRRRPSARRRS